MDVNLNITALEKLVDYTASGIGSVAGSMLAPWKAHQAAKAALINAKSDSEILKIQAEAQSKARKTLVSQDANVTGEIDIQDAINQRIQFQEQKRQANIVSVVEKAANQLGNTEVADSEPDHDWTARFFNEVQDVSSEEMQSLWARVLAGEVKQAGSTSVRTLGILKNLDQDTALLFRKFCSVCIFSDLDLDGKHIFDARVSSLGGRAENNSLSNHGLGFFTLNHLNEHGLIISAYDSWSGYPSIKTTNNDGTCSAVPFRFQDRYWILSPINERAPTKGNRQHQTGRICYTSTKGFRLHGVALNQSGRELSQIVEPEPADKFSRDLDVFFESNNLKMTEVEIDRSGNYGSWNWNIIK